MSQILWKDVGLPGVVLPNSPPLTSNLALTQLLPSFHSASSMRTCVWSDGQLTQFFFLLKESLAEIVIIQYPSYHVP